MHHNEDPLPFQKLDVYRVAKEFVQLVHVAKLRDRELRETASSVSAKSTAPTASEREFCEPTKYLRRIARPLRNAKPQATTASVIQAHGWHGEIFPSDTGVRQFRFSPLQ